MSTYPLDMLSAGKSFLPTTPMAIKLSRPSPIKGNLIPEFNTPRLHSSKPQMNKTTGHVSGPVLAEMGSWLATSILEHMNALAARQKAATTKQKHVPQTPSKASTRLPTPPQGAESFSVRDTNMPPNYASPTKSSVQRNLDMSPGAARSAKPDLTHQHAAETKGKNRIGKTLTLGDKKAVIKKIFGVSVNNPGLIEWALKAPFGDAARVFGKTSVSDSRHMDSPSGSRTAIEPTKKGCGFEQMQAGQNIPAPPLPLMTPTALPPSSPVVLQDKQHNLMVSSNTHDTAHAHKSIAPNELREPTTPPGSPNRSHLPTTMLYAPSGTPYYIWEEQKPGAEVDRIPTAVFLTPPKPGSPHDSEARSVTLWGSDSEQEKSPPYSPTHPLSPTHPFNLSVEELVRHVKKMKSFKDMLDLCKQPQEPFDTS